MHSRISTRFGSTSRGDNLDAADRVLADIHAVLGAERIPAVLTTERVSRAVVTPHAVRC
jgi:hypothetical protein